MSERHGDYGYDAPYALALLTALGVGGVVASVVASGLRDRAATPLALAGAFYLANAFSFFYTTRRGKFQVWEEILGSLHLHGDERVLDMGCGRGAVLTAVAGRLRTGRATGLDLWSTHDQSGNSSVTTLRNASLENVRERLSVATGDMRAMPFADSTFDIVVSSLAIHNIRSHAARALAIGDAWRVLKPGGRLAIADIRVTARYAAALKGLGATDVKRRRLGWRFWYGNPFAATTLVTATKPAH